MPPHEMVPSSKTDAAVGRDVNLRWRCLALLLDLLILGPPIALLCVAGSFASETTHQVPNLAYLLAAGIAVAYAIGEAVRGVTPGLKIIGARIVDEDQGSGVQSTYVRRGCLRWGMKYGLVVVPYLIAVLVAAIRGIEDVYAQAAMVAAVIAWACAAVMMIISVTKHVLSGGRRPQFFDRAAKTNVIFTRRER